MMIRHDDLHALAGQPRELRGLGGPAIDENHHFGAGGDEVFDDGAGTWVESEGWLARVQLAIVGWCLIYALSYLTP